MNHFIENVGLLLRVTIGAKVMTGVLILMRLLHPPSFPFFQPISLFSLALFEVGVLILLGKRHAERRYAR